MLDSTGDLTLKVEFEVEGGGSFIVPAAVGETLTQVAYRGGVTIQQTCGGTPSCTDCRVKILKGIDSGFQKIEGPELRLMGNVYFINHERLSCQALVAGDSKVFVPKYQRREKKLKRSK